MAFSSSNPNSRSASTPTAATPPAPASPIATNTTTSNTAAAGDADKLPALLKNDPARTGYDPGTAWWMNYFKILTGGVTAEGQFHYREDRTRANEARDVRRCEEMRDHLLAHSPVVRYLRDRVADLNGTLDAATVACRRCPARLTADGQVHRQSGGFSPDSGILLCANEVAGRAHLEDTLAHEMVHAWDHLRFKVDFRGDTNLKHAACTEVNQEPVSPLHACPSWLTGRFCFVSPPDPRLHAERRVSMDQGVLRPRQLDADPAVSRVRAQARHHVRHGPPALPGRRTGHQSRQPGLGLVLRRYPALRRSLQIATPVPGNAGPAATRQCTIASFRKAAFGVKGYDLTKTPRDAG